MSTDFARHILEHFRNGGTLQDRRIEALYRCAHHLTPDAVTETEAVRRWAYDVATGLDLKAGPWHVRAKPDTHSRATGEE